MNEIYQKLGKNRFKIICLLFLLFTDLFTVYYLNSFYSVDTEQYYSQALEALQTNPNLAAEAQLDKQTFVEVFELAKKGILFGAGLFMLFHIVMYILYYNGKNFARVYLAFLTGFLIFTNLLGVISNPLKSIPFALGYLFFFIGLLKEKDLFEVEKTEEVKAPEQ
ncbi:MAG: hypothetical protein ACPGJV_06010 [Bacteriovoracaceae bacterium]